MLSVVLVGILFAAVAMVLNSCGALLQAEGARRATRTKPAAIQPRYLAASATIRAKPSATSHRRWPVPVRPEIAAVSWPR